jgi:hypothetical protein
LISHQLAVLPDTDDIWEKNDRGIFMNSLSLGFSGVGFDAINLER